MTKDEIRTKIDFYKNRLKVESDKEFAEAIGSSYSNVNKWIQRLEIPPKWELKIDKACKHSTLLFRKNELQRELNALYIKNIKMELAEIDEEINEFENTFEEVA